MMAQDAKEPIPQLVTKDGERKPVGSTMTRDELLEAIKLVVGGQQQAEEIVRQVARQTAADVSSAIYDRMEGQLRDGEWNIKNYPARSVLNPLGEKDHPRPDIHGEIFWVGTLLRKDEHTREEIELLNKLQPGVYHNGEWKVIDLAPGVRNQRKLLVVFPCADRDKRSELPSMVEMLRIMTGEVGEPALAGV